MKILVLGGDGYCGWATALYLSQKGHQVAIADNFARRQWDYELGVQTLTPIRPMPERLRAWKRITGEDIEFFLRRHHRLRVPVLRRSRRSSRTPWCILPSSAPLPTP